ncbi:MAG TPA: Hpt domain-containing protein [Stellaceae bacterium]|jgi:HPt (histidine-containing phosphotransfer) domain-containing protein|nr:Hpt domain-containing protein [Stellaceae bacterium]
MNSVPLIDKPTLDDLIEAIGEDGARSVLGLFVGESRNYLKIIAEAAANPSDAARRERARRAAHSFKSGAGQVGAAAVAAAAAAVEQAAQAGSDVAKAATVLETCTAETIEAFAPMLG